jgi:hypothetical protein
MLRLKRPEKPVNFDKTVERYRKRTEAAFQPVPMAIGTADPAGQSEKRKKRPFKFMEKWKDYKGAFILAQNGRCGYCEGPVAGFCNGDVEHFRPKGDVCLLSDNEGDWGTETPDGRCVGRTPQQVCETGYWWLAYEWDNYLFACERCNRTYKGSLFPITEDPRPLVAPGVAEHPLLLSPFDGPDPALHLCFTEDGFVEPYLNSQCGKETIKTCGLNRTWLLNYRRKNAQKAHRLAQELLDAPPGKDKDTVLESWYELGSTDPESLPGFPGMVRIIFEQKCGVSWHLIEDFMKERAAQKPQTDEH